MKKTQILLFLLISVSVIAKETAKNKKIEIEFSGFIKYDATYDTRQTVNSREGIFLLFPDRPLLDKENNDVNAVSNFNMCTINSNLKLNLSGPIFFNAKTDAFFEVDFWGSESNKYIDLNHIRLRHAYIKLDWGKTKLLLGQYWNPMSVTGFFPRVVSSNSGVPFHPISRNPQIQIAQQLGNLRIIGTLLTQRDFTSTGPNGSDSKYLRNSGIPNAHLQVQYGNNSSTFIAGAGIDYKMIVPELYSSSENNIIKTGKKNTLSSLCFVGFMNIETNILSIRMQGVYGQNTHDIMLLGGYAVREVVNISTGEKRFSNLNTIASWIDLQTTGKQVNVGVFGGYTKNWGSRSEIEGPIYARGASIDRIYRISPRIVYEKSPFIISAECEYTSAAYGTENGTAHGGVTNSDFVSNIRTIVSIKYYF